MLQRKSWLPALAALAVAVILGSGSAHATLMTYEFNYDFGIGSLSGELTGTLQPDGDTVLVDELLSAELDTFPVLFNLDLFPGFATVTFSGIGIEFATDFTLGLGLAGFALDEPAGVAALIGPGGNVILEAYNPDSWTLTAVTSNDVPEPISLAMFGFGPAGLGFIRRRRSA